MKKTLAGVSTVAALFLAGCSSTSSNHSTNNQGVRQYRLSGMPQANISGGGTLMPGAYANGPEMNHGRFSGQERTMTGVGQRPTLAPAEDSREYARGEEPATKGNTPQPSAAGSVANNPPQKVILVTPATAAVSALTTSGAGASATPTLGAPLTAGGSSALGGPARTQTGIGTSIDSPGTGLASPSRDANLGPLAQSIEPRDSLNTGLSGRVREALSTGRPGAITTLTPDRLGQVRIEAQNGNVTLRGTANSETEKLMLGQRISRLQGVSSVNNQLRVISPSRGGMNDATDPARRTDPLEQFDKRPAQVPQ